MRHYTTCPFKKASHIANREYKLRQEALKEMGYEDRDYPRYWKSIYEEVIEEQVGKDNFIKSERDI